METYMSSRLYKAATAGDVHYLSSLDTVSDSKERNERHRCHDLLSLTLEKNNCLHIAAKFGHDEYVQKVLNLCPSLVYQQNRKGDNPLHVAARAGHLGIVKLLINSFKRLQSRLREADQEEEETIIQNEENSTTLSLADCVQPPPPTTSDQSQNNIRKNSATTSGGGDDITCDRSLTEAEEGERPSSPMWRTQIQQNSTAQTNSIQPHLGSTQIESTGGTVTRTTTSEWPSLPIWLAQNHEGSTALHVALRKKHEDLALYLLDLDRKQVVLVVNAKNESPLYLAAEAGFVGALENILNAGGSNNFVGPMGQTPLHAAVFARSAGCIQVLHESIPGLTKKQDSSGKTALCYATQSNSLKIMRQLLRLDASSAYIWDNEGLSPLLVAASVQGQPTVKVILDACPVSIESTDNRGRNALHLAVKHNTARILRRLLRMPEIKALINQPDKEGNTPLHLATIGHKYSHVRALLSTKCVDLTGKNDSGETALDLCALDWELTARQTRIWRVLRRRKASLGRFPLLMQLTRPPSIFGLMHRANAADLKQVINMLAVVASLLATITFAAVFQLPGGYKADGQYIGSPSLIHKPAFKVFVISDSISLCLSVTALFPLVLATWSDKTFLTSTISLCQILIACALFAAMIAFISGLYLVLSMESMWLAIFLCIVGPTFYILSEWVYSMAHTRTPFVQGSLRKHKTRVISRERDLEE